MVTRSCEKVVADMWKTTEFANIVSEPSPIFTPVELLTPKYIPDYRAQLDVAMDDALAQLTEAVSAGSSDLMRVYESAVHSSRSRGARSLFRCSRPPWKPLVSSPPRDVQEVADLVSAYQFAQQHPLNTANLLEAHRIASTLLVHANDQGQWRTKGVKVGNAITTVYMAPHQTLVPGLMDQLMQEVDALSSKKLATDEAFYYAALLHLAFVNIHPFIDGNGRSARLLEKWFLAKHIGPIAWSIRSEKYIINHRDEYYDTLALLGNQWGILDYDLCIPFLLLLTRSLRNK
ncbi:MAG: Fic family protein [Flavobacteriales bacterium]|nr:Fic family protein [Flavobacteriales bacterium]